ncbi:hypothetical protein NQ314_013310 [Rhamnusium bicolor]|uniref:Uncharacterized protein n=1 Tax=Rhamnusium bicolor TaxID=1586634 RepID=A0AAV8X7K7_9CUCU|nr:hypothetical protein NQ314_013310 [Rhamnusium bicolor]
MGQEKEEEDCDKLITRNSSAVYKDTTVPVKKNNTVLEKICNLFDLQLLKQVPYVLVVIGLGNIFCSRTKCYFDDAVRFT